MTIQTTRFQYESGESDLSAIAPESYTLDQHFLDRPESAEVQLDLFHDYKSNIEMYPIFQSYFRTHQPPFLAIWGNRDPFFHPAGAEAFKRDNPKVEVKLLDAGHFILESHVEEVGSEVRRFLARTIDQNSGEALFGDLSVHEPSALAIPHLEVMRSVFGFVPNLGYALAVEPAVLGVYLQILHALQNTSLDPLAQQVAMVAASRANDAEYGVSVHSTLAAKLGASSDLVRALRSGSSLDDPKLEAVRRFAGSIALNHTQPSDDDIAAIRAAGLDKKAMVSIALAAAAKTLVNTVAHLARPEVDAAFWI